MVLYTKLGALFKLVLLRFFRKDIIAKDVVEYA